MKKTLTIVLLLAAAGYVASTCFVAVDETEFVIIKRFGRPRTTVLTPGLCLKWPVLVETVVRFDNRLQVFEDPRPQEPAKEYLTRDKKNVEVATAACWRIARDSESVLAFLSTVQDKKGAELRLCDMVKSQLNGVLGAQDFDSLISTNGSGRHWHETIEAVQRACAERAAGSFGIEVVDLRIQRLSFPAQNRRSVFERMRAERERIAKQYRSEGEAQAMRIIADAQSEQERILAEARAAAARIRGNADAEATRIYGAAYSIDPEFYRFMRTLQSYERGLDSDTVLVLPADAQFLQLLVRPDTAPVESVEPDPTLDIQKLTHDGQADRHPEPAPGS